MRLAAIFGVVALASGCAASGPAGSAISPSWEPLPAASAEPFPGQETADRAQELTLGEPVELEGFLYEVVDAVRWDRSASDDGWCVAVQIHEETPEEDTGDPLVGWTVRDETGTDHFFDFGCLDGTRTPEQPHDLGADELQPGMAEGHRYWIIFDVPDSEHLWLFRTWKTDGDLAMILQLR